MQVDMDTTASAEHAAVQANRATGDDGTLQSTQTAACDIIDIRSQTKSSLWTVADLGKIPPPTSDDYSCWTVEQLRKECTSRKMRLGRKTSVEEPVQRLLQFDELHRSMVSATLASTAGGSSDLSPSSGNDNIRLLNVLFSDTFAERFARIGDKPSRVQLDAGETHRNSTFWRDVTSEFNTNRTDYNALFSSDIRFEGVDASVAVIHGAVSLYEMWKDVNKRYLKAMAKFTKPGEHDDDFFAYCEGALGTFYLRECLAVKHDLTSFVEGGLFKEDQFDSLKRGQSQSDATSQNTSHRSSTKKQRSDIVESVNALAAAIAPAEPTTVEKLMSLHKLIQQVERRIEELQENGKSGDSLQTNTDIYRAKLSKLEAAFMMKCS
ncbi:hypothetical protein PF005_g13754 [Phytophthora fragariae]|uniref:SAP domain-containing protein n=2 Tax=Phytophthora fragariae TaxID=53985 RepID=A0A6A3XWI2_9STRA|nr:hypothetical protein PF003_g39517 [Phytophthora fragariae]KAE9107306.1 hypothetical protein PF007_g13084 [Phytophthora fragariae]KAE9204529.1 hypothetical protein PF005_g13754 [Phytophthora fragariae]KAE9232969.1 hypothetical protein PF002_g12225 [Phytophthora fragariae]KAE9304472.1 hypothetical protein PF001_g13058 [Phytophthora fragariae]